MRTSVVLRPGNPPPSSSPLYWGSQPAAVGRARPPVGTAVRPWRAGVRQRGAQAHRRYRCRRLDGRDHRHGQRGQLRALRCDVDLAGWERCGCRDRRCHRQFGQGHLREHLGPGRRNDHLHEWRTGAQVGLIQGHWRPGAHEGRERDPAAVWVDPRQRRDGSDGVIHLKGTMDIIGTTFGCPS